ncbi:MAG: gluconate 2-dehydrogenase subunit 3 family protein [Bacteroidetes bacterium]|nr:gluconate 2-dehydrogenase subunit 3 family protein [Bacteroidota bacterium]
MNRRDAIHRMAALLGGTLSAPLVAGMLSGCRPSDHADWTPQTLTAHQNELVITLSEHIIPATDTPGAKAAQVNRFIDLMLTDWYPDDAATHFLSELDTVDPRARQLFGTPFLEGTAEQQTNLLTAFADAARQAEESASGGGAYGNAATGDDAPPPFFSMLKEMTMVGYYNSEIGQNQELNYRIVPGRYDGCVPVEDVYPHLDEAAAESA